jgi:hypothetical protein
VIVARWMEPSRIGDACMTASARSMRAGMGWCRNDWGGQGGSGF